MSETNPASQAGADEIRVRETKTVTLVGAGVNVVLAAVKLAAGLVSGSSAMVADAFHTISDLVADVMVYISIGIAAKEADEDHPYGHGRAETIAAGAVGGSLIVVGLYLVVEVGQKLIEGRLALPTWPALAAAVVSLVVKESLYHYTVIVGRRHNNQAVIATAWHHRSDALSSIAAFIGIGGAMMGYPILDPLAAVVVVFMIVKAGMDITWEAMHDLMDASLSPEKMEELGQVIRMSPGVNDYHELRTRRVGGKLFIDAHIQVAPAISVSEAHNIAETVRGNLRRISGAADALVHIDAENDMQYRVIHQSREQVERKVAQLVAQADGALGFSQVVIHYLGGKTMVEFTMELGDHVSIGQARALAEGLKEKLEDGEIIHQVVIRGKLTDHAQ